MPRYIDADKLKEEISNITFLAMGGRTNGKTIFTEALNSYREKVFQSIDNTTTADVVLRAELVTQTFKDAMRIASLQRRNGNLTALVKALITSISTDKEEEAYNKGYEDAKADLLEKLQADIARDEILAEYGDELFEGRIAGFKALISYLKEEGDT